jgi:PPK2 family polyphosphate:nucleotide phosphotransferase
MTLSDTLRSMKTLADVDVRSTPGFDGDKASAKWAMKDMVAEMAELQEKLYAGATQGDARSVLVLLQGMDTSGKGGTIESVLGMVNPQGTDITSFKKPTEEELAHDFLWRIQKALPPAGRIGVFDRSQYEDVLIVRVHELVPADEIERRYDAINEFEKAYAETGGVLIKCLLHIDKDTQKERLEARLGDPTKYWKYNPDDLKERALWDSYAESYQLILDRCSTDVAPWHVVPSGRKWYRNWAVATLLLDALRDLNLNWPPADFDVKAEQRRVAKS